MSSENWRCSVLLAVPLRSTLRAAMCPRPPSTCVQAFACHGWRIGWSQEAHGPAACLGACLGKGIFITAPASLRNVWAPFWLTLRIRIVGSNPGTTLHSWVSEHAKTGGTTLDDAASLRWNTQWSYSNGKTHALPSMLTTPAPAPAAAAAAMPGQRCRAAMPSCDGCVDCSSGIARGRFEALRQMQL